MKLKTTTAAFQEWLDSAVNGSRAIYHQGYLACDKGALSDPPSEKQAAIRALGRTAYQAFTLGLVHLVQAKRGPGDYDYCAIKR